MYVYRHPVMTSKWKSEMTIYMLPTPTVQKQLSKRRIAKKYMENEKKKHFLSRSTI